MPKKAALRAAVFSDIREKLEGADFAPPPPSSARVNILPMSYNGAVREKMR